MPGPGPSLDRPDGPEERRGSLAGRGQYTARVSEPTQAYGINRLRETWVVREQTRRSMQGNRSKGTKPELALRRALWAAGARGYRVNVRKLPGTPDVVFGPARVCVFVQGCFWHGCPRCRDGKTPTQNAEFWRTKVETNQARHDRDSARLREAGYAVVTVWECELKQSLAEVAGLVLDLAISRCP